MSEQEHKNDASELRSLLFQTIRGVRDGSVDSDKANAISNAAKQIVNIELAAIKMVDTLGGNYESEFLPAGQKSPRPAALDHTGKPRLGFARG